MCEYCGSERKLIEDEYANYEARITKLTPLPPINLESGTIGDVTEPPYFALFVGSDLNDSEEASFVIHYCPMCGRKLS